MLLLLAAAAASTTTTTTTTTTTPNRTYTSRNKAPFHERESQSTAVLYRAPYADST